MSELSGTDIIENHGELMKMMEELHASDNSNETNEKREKSAV